MEDPIIKLENVWKIYQLGKIELVALKDISLGLKKGSFTAIIGPSGSGKSTFLDIIGCLDLPTKGKVFLNREDISLLSENRLARIRGEKIGFIFQQFNLFQNLNALENVALPMSFLGVPEKKRKKRARELLSMLGLGERIDHKPSELSGGEQQRVAIARALANNPDIVVADEPTGNLDSKTGEMIMSIFRKLHSENKKTVIVVTHNLNVAGYAQETIYLKDGQVIN